MKRCLRRPAADRDLIRLYRWFARSSGLRAADRFFREAESTLIRLQGVPNLGSPYRAEDPAFGSLRFCPISRHRSYLIFYRTIPDGIEVYRILHGARDIHAILSDELGIDSDLREDTD
ncbi:type II toxin-antitoxin system RelE/ParE family toxin [Tundrisphaera sp. TA3]|uniref:type II toxin-antitoxin system RelE/ParE family toxin n=1 Tax=Tundrisphaera sp. TA3 TaxID=3435775 RepID=UPI003EBC6546